MLRLCSLSVQLNVLLFQADKIGCYYDKRLEEM